MIVSQRMSYWSSSGWKILVAFLTFTYGVQSMAYYLFPVGTYAYRHEDPDSMFFLSVLVFALLVIVFSIGFFIKSKKSVFVLIEKLVIVNLGNLVRVFWFKYRTFHVFLFLVSAIFWFSDGLASYRYDGISISNKLTPTLLIGMLWKFFIITDFWFWLVMAKNSGGKFVYKHKYIINISLLLTLTGTTSVLYYIIHTLVVFFPKKILKVMDFSISSALSNNPLKFVKLLVFSVGLSVVLLYGYHVGEIIKTNREMSFSERFSSEKLSDLFKNFFVQRFSTTLYSHTYLMEYEEYSFQDYFYHASIPIQNFVYRVNVLFGQPIRIDRHEYASINQLNYQTMLLFGKDETSGASPGLIPGFMYLMPNWLAIFIASVYFAAICIAFGFATKKTTFLFASLSMLLLLDLFKAPTEGLNPMSPTFFQIIFFLGCVGVLIKQKQSLITSNQ